MADGLRAWGAALAGAVLLGMASVPGVPWTTIGQGDQSGHREAANVVIRDADSWQRLWAQHGTGRLPSPPLPSIDFARDMVIGVFLGERPSGGFAIEVTGVKRRSDRLVVRVRQTAPDPGALHTMALTAAHHLVRLPASSLPVVFETRLAP